MLYTPLTENQRRSKDTGEFDFAGDMLSVTGLINFINTETETGCKNWPLLLLCCFFITNISHKQFVTLHVRIMIRTHYNSHTRDVST